MKALEQFAVIDRLSGGRLATTVSRGFLGPFWGQFGVPEERLLGRFQETLRIWRWRWAASASTSTASTGRCAAGGWRRFRLRRGRSGAGATRRRRRSGARPSTARPGRAIRCRSRAPTGTRRPASIASRARELGKRPFVVRMQDGWVADTREEALRSLRPALRADGRLLRPLEDGPRRSARPTPPTTCSRAPPTTASHACRSSTRTGASTTSSSAAALSTGPSLEAAREQIARFGEQVVQPIHARYPAPDHPAIPPPCRTVKGLSLSVSQWLSPRARRSMIASIRRRVSARSVSA